MVLGMFPEAVLPEDDGLDHRHPVHSRGLVGDDVLLQETRSLHIRKYSHSS